MGAIRPVKQAFLVGVSDYGDPVRDLPFCKRDVKSLSQVLSRKGFKCKSWVDKALQPLVPNGELKKFFAKAKSAEDTIVFYFSGHGVDIDGVQILRGRGVATADLKKSLTGNGNLLALSTVLDEMSTSPAQKVVIIDACRLPEEVPGLSESLQKARRTAFEKISNCVVIYASADGTGSFGTPDNKASRFTLSLTEELKQYGRGVLPTAEAVISRVSSCTDLKRQTPWLYASLRDRPLDGFRIEQEALSASHSPRLVAQSGNVVWAVLSGSRALAKYTANQLLPQARLPAALSGSMYTFEPHPGGSRHAFVKPLSKSVHLVEVLTAAATWQKTAIVANAKTVPGMMRVFGARWSSAGSYLAAFGSPDANKLGLVLWSDTAGNFKSEKVQGLPLGLEINAVTWVTGTSLLVAGTRDPSSRSYVYHLEIGALRWEASCCWASQSPLRITSMLVAADHDRVYLGADNGSVAEGRLSLESQPEYLDRKHRTSGFSSMAVLPWRGDSIQKDFVEVGVCAMAFDEQHELLGLTYFDGTVAFWDPIFRSFVTSFQLPRGARRPGIVCVEPGLFLCSDGDRGSIFKIVEC
jgi:hypothetical protein